jgi:hypothetical protein
MFHKHLNVCYGFRYSTVKVKVRVTPETCRAGTEVGVEVYLYLCFTPREMEVGGQRHPPAALPQGNGGWVGLGDCLDGCGKSRPHRLLNPEPSGP